MSDRDKAIVSWMALTAVFVVAAVAASLAGAIADYATEKPATSYIRPAAEFVFVIFASMFFSFLATISFVAGTVLALRRRICRARSVRFLIAGIAGFLSVAGTMAIAAFLPYLWPFPVPLLCMLSYAAFVPGLVAYYLIGYKPKQTEKAAFPVRKNGDMSQ